MALLQKSYEEIRENMKPGDVIAFSGQKLHSNAIKIFTDSIVSHVGVIFSPKPPFNRVAEATTSGVTITKLSERVCNYGGKMWWLPLSKAARGKLDLQKFSNFLLRNEGKPYDIWQAIGAGVDVLDKLGITRNREDFEEFFCSELVAGALEKGGVIANINASEVTPIDLCRFNIYAKNYVQFKGEEKRIIGFNSSDPAKWR